MKLALAPDKWTRFRSNIIDTGLTVYVTRTANHLLTSSRAARADLIFNCFFARWTKQNGKICKQDLEFISVSRECSSLARICEFCCFVCAKRVFALCCCSAEWRYKFFVWSPHWSLCTVQLRRKEGNGEIVQMLVGILFYFSLRFFFLSLCFEGGRSSSHEEKLALIYITSEYKWKIYPGISVSESEGNFCLFSHSIKFGWKVFFSLFFSARREVGDKMEDRWIEFMSSSEGVVSPPSPADSLSHSLCSPLSN